MSDSLKLPSAKSLISYKPKSKLSGLASYYEIESKGITSNSKSTITITLVVVKSDSLILTRDYSKFSYSSGTSI